MVATSGRPLSGILTAILFCSAGAAHAQATAIPDFSSNNLAWIGMGSDLVPPPSGPGPVVFDPAHPYISNERARATGQQPNFRVADLRNPILQPWVVEALRKQNEEALSGKIVFSRESRCWPIGVTGFLLNPAQPIFFLQTPDEVWMVFEQGHRVRRVALNQQHSAQPKPSWYGESIGHYEGDVLVVDTIALSEKTYVDNYRTPHTEQLHIVERFRMIDGGRVLEATILIDDPGAFTTPWTAIRRFRRTEARPMEEVVCPENNERGFGYDADPIPQDRTPDF
jgi:hypothetical protein